MLPDLVVLNLFKISVVEQAFETDVFKGNVMRGNDIILKCIFPSHVADMVSVTAWVDSEGISYVIRGEYGNYSQNYNLALPRIKIR